MDRGLALLQQFRQQMEAQAAYLRRCTYAKSVRVGPVQDRTVTVTFEWDRRLPFSKTYTLEELCGPSYLLQPLAWKLQLPPCVQAKKLGQEALTQRL